MKRHISLLVAMLLLVTMLPMGVMADGSVTVSKVYNSIEEELATGGSIATVEGELTVQFSGAVTADVLENIAFTGAGYNGAVVTEPDAEDNTKVKVKFGRLAEGSYTLTAGGESFSYTAATKYLTNTDFTEYPQYDEATATQPALDGYLAEDNLGLIRGGYAAYDATIARMGTNPTYKYPRLGILPSYAAAGGVGNQHGLVVLGNSSILKNGDFNDVHNVNDDKVYILDSSYYPNGNQPHFGTLLHDTNLLDTKTMVVYGQNAKTKNTDNDEQEADYWENGYRPRMLLVREDGALRQHVYSRAQDGSVTYLAKGTYACAADAKVSRLVALSYYYGATSKKPMYISSVACFPERLLSILKFDAFDTANNQIVLHMSDDVKNTEGVPVGEVVVTKDGEAVSLSGAQVNNEERTMTLTFGSSLEAGTYDVDISALYAENDLKAYTAVKSFTLETASEEQPFNAPTVADYYGKALENGGTIRTIDGKLTLTFEAPVDEYTLEGITIEGAKGAIVKEAEGNVVTLRFGRLAEDTAYTLSVPATVKALDGRSVTPLALSFTAEKEWLTNADFSDETKYPLYDEANGQTQLVASDNLNYLDGWSATDTKYARVLEEASEGEATDRYLSISPAYGEGAANKAYGLTVHADAAMGNNFNTTANVDAERVYVIEAGIRHSHSDTTASFGLPATDSGAINGTNHRTMVWSNGRMATNMNFDPAVTLRDGYYRYALDGTWARPRMVLRRGASGTLLQDAYDMANDGLFVGTVKSELAANKAITRFSVLNEYLQSAGLSRVLDYTYVQAYPDVLPTVLASGYNAGLATLSFSDDLDEATLENIVVTNIAGQTVEYEYSYTAEERKLEINLPDAAQYSIDLSAVQSTAGLRMYPADAVQGVAIPSVTAVAFTDGTNEITTAAALAAAQTVSVTAGGENLPAGCVAYLAVYGEGGCLLDVVQATVTNGVITAATTKALTGATQATLFVWESLRTLRPLVAAEYCL